ncbi:9691_t:CDS:2 [Paraglomus brasilianum]|uniref:9691_t:CDS:1 n=1 Tax=Paraglomus brasilianum TaxID=144538 RepID=A0A9N9G698_9GLOM|nr:9691_t:CDS:2 [Paraglomus brasilianum]
MASTSPITSPKKRKLSNSSPGEETRRVITEINTSKKVKPDSASPGTIPHNPDLLLRLTKKEEEVQTLLTELQSLSQVLTPDFSYDPSLRKKFLDPAINVLFRTMKKDIEEKNKIIEELQRELEGINFTSNSITGKKLVAKLKALQSENEELGRQLRQGRVEQYEVEISLQRKMINELKASLEESEEQNHSLDSEIEKLQDIVLQQAAKLKRYEEKSNRVLEDTNQ